MENKWQFDREFMLKTIWYIQSLLRNPKTSTKAKKNLKENLLILTNLIEKNYDSDNFKSNIRTFDLEKQKRIALNKMRLTYKTLGFDLINWFLDLTILGIFDLDFSLKNQQTNLNLDEQANLSLENYTIHSKKYLDHAKEIILSSNQIELANELSCSSYNIYSDLTKLFFMVINPNEAPWILNHETQHAIEDILKYPCHDMYDELGPQYFELLFLDNLYNNQGYLLTGDYIKKIEETKDLLDVLYGYFNSILVLSQRNFDVSLEELITIIMERYEVDLETTYKILEEELVTNEPLNDMNYLFSYLKAIELRERTILTKKSSDSILEPYIKDKRFKFYPPTDIDMYKRFI